MRPSPNRTNSHISDCPPKPAQCFDSTWRFNQKCYAQQCICPASLLLRLTPVTANAQRRIQPGGSQGPPPFRLVKQQGRLSKHWSTAAHSAHNHTSRKPETSVLVLPRRWARQKNLWHMRLPLLPPTTLPANYQDRGPRQPARQQRGFRSGRNMAKLREM
jgi:hypothetical protein